MGLALVSYSVYEISALVFSGLFNTRTQLPVGNDLQLVKTGCARIALGKAGYLFFIGIINLRIKPISPSR
jgi:intracellular septation protein A